MAVRTAIVLAVIALLPAARLRAQAPQGTNGGKWEASEGAETAKSSSAATSLAPSGATTSNPSITRVEKGDTLPNEHGHVLRFYDISPYTSRVKSTAKPEQAIIDWVLRETGTEVWFSEPLGFLSADSQRLTAYHTPEMQQIVRDVVDRFNSTKAESEVFGLRLITIGSPNWRGSATRMLRPVSVQSPGVDAWLMSKEDAAILVANLRKRIDFREHSSPNLLIHNGQAQTLNRTRPRSYVKAVRLLENSFPAHQLEMGQIDEGYSLQISPLLSLDERTVDAVIKCNIDQIEKLLPVTVEVPSLPGQTQRVQTQVPQMVSWRLHERFRWPTDQVLLLSCGVVATPAPESGKLLGLPNPLIPNPGRADALLFIESKGKASQALVSEPQTASAPGSYRGRY